MLLTEESFDSNWQVTSGEYTLDKRHLRALHFLQVSGCTCMTKTPETRYHDKTCKYRIFSEIQKFLVDAGRAAAATAQVADALEAEYLAVANGQKKPAQIALEPMVQAVAHLRRSQQTVAGSPATN